MAARTAVASSFTSLSMRAWTSALATIGDTSYVHDIVMHMSMQSGGWYRN
jgi:hypothetical protein